MASNVHNILWPTHLTNFKWFVSTISDEEFNTQCNDDSKASRQCMIMFNQSMNILPVQQCHTLQAGARVYRVGITCTHPTCIMVNLLRRVTSPYCPEKLWALNQSKHVHVSKSRSTFILYFGSYKR